MEAHSDWYSQIASNIRLRKDSLSKKNYKRYNLDLLLRAAARVDGFSSNVTIQAQILDLLKHLQKNHGLLTQGQNIGLWTALSIGLGVALGIALGNTAIGVAIGTALGIAIGSVLDAKAKKEGRVI